jgi:hypothetical protein
MEEDEDIIMLDLEIGLGKMAQGEATCDGEIPRELIKGGRPAGYQRLYRVLKGAWKEIRISEYMTTGGKASSKP